MPLTISSPPIPHAPDPVHSTLRTFWIWSDHNVQVVPPIEPDDLGYASAGRQSLGCPGNAMCGPKLKLRPGAHLFPGILWSSRRVLWFSAMSTYSAHIG